MKKIVNRLVLAFLFAIPVAGESYTIAYSPTRAGQPLVFVLNSMRLSQFSAVTWSQLQNALFIQSTYSNHLDDLLYRNCCGQWNLWIDGMGQWLGQDTDPDEQFGYRDFTGGFTIGVDRCYKNFSVGGAFSYTHSSLDWKEGAGDATINSYYGGIYSRWNNDLFYVNGLVLGAYSDYDVTRHLRVRLKNLHAVSNHHGWEALAGIESGVMLEKLFCRTDLVPFAGVDYVYLAQQGYSESGAYSGNLHVESRNDQLFQSQIGLQFIHRFYCGCWIIAPDLSLSYINQTPIAVHHYETTVISLDHQFDVDGWSFERNLGALSFCMNFIDSNGILAFNLRYDGQYGGNYWTQTGSLTCNLRF
jgi:outer membrane autotransporter protein